MKFIKEFAEWDKVSEELKYHIRSISFWKAIRS